MAWWRTVARIRQADSFHQLGSGGDSGVDGASGRYRSVVCIVRGGAKPPYRHDSRRGANLGQCYDARWRERSSPSSPPTSLFERELLNENLPSNMFGHLETDAIVHGKTASRTVFGYMNEMAPFANTSSLTEVACNAATSRR